MKKKQQQKKSRQSISEIKQSITVEKTKRQQLFTCISNRDCVIILSIFLITITLLSGVMGYNIYKGLSRMDQKLQKIQLKFHKFLFYVKYIYKSEKNQEKMEEEQSNSIKNFLEKISKGYQQRKDKEKGDQGLSVNMGLANDTIGGEKIEEGKVGQKGEEGKQGGVELLSDKEVIDIAMKIIQEEKIQNPTIQSQLSQQQAHTLNNNTQQPLQTNTKPSPQSPLQSQPFLCHIDTESIFYRNFQYDPQTQRVRKTKYTSRFQPIICDQPIPKNGIYQLSIKILRTQKSFIYIGIIGGQRQKVNNLTSLHESPNFYGYSGYSGRIWQATKRKNAYQMLQANTIFKLKVNMDDKIVQYFYNELKVGESLFGGLCQKECWFVVEMYNDGDQLEFLQTVDLEVADIPNIEGIEL